MKETKITIAILVGSLMICASGFYIESLFEKPRPLATVTYNPNESVLIDREDIQRLAKHMDEYYDEARKREAAEAKVQELQDKINGKKPTPTPTPDASSRSTMCGCYPITTFGGGGTYSTYSTYPYTCPCGSSR